jgi:hypothetical protein
MTYRKGPKETIMSVGEFRIVKIIVFFVVLNLIGCTDAENLTGSNNYTAEEPFSFNVSVQAQSGIRLAGIAGTVTVTGNANATGVSITGKRIVEAQSQSDAIDHLKQLQVNVEDLGNEVYVETIQPSDNQGRNYIVDYTIVVPQTFRVQVSNVAGTVTVSSTNNSVLVNSVTGSVALNQINGNATVSLVTGTIDGRITLPANGTIDLSTVTGSINLRIPAVTSAQVSASVTTGSIVTSNLVFQSQTSASTSFVGKLGDGKGTITLRAVTGGITIAGV